MRKTIYLLLLMIISAGTYSQNQKAKKETEKVYTIVEVKPQFPGGEDSLSVFLGRNLKYPAIAAENGIFGTVVASFVVLSNGSIGDVEILRPLDPACDKEVIRLIKSLPKWTPGRQKGFPVAVSITLPINFKLQ